MSVYCLVVVFSVLCPDMYNNIVHDGAVLAGGDATPRAPVHPRAPRLGGLGSRLEDYARHKLFRHFLAARTLLPPDAPCFVAAAGAGPRAVVTDEEYLGGAIGMCHDLARAGVDRASRAGTDPTAVPFVRGARDACTRVLEELLQFDFRNGPLRRKYDSTKYALKTLETVLCELRAPRLPPVPRPSLVRCFPRVHPPAPAYFGTQTSCPLQGRKGRSGRTPPATTGARRRGSRWTRRARAGTAERRGRTRRCKGGPRPRPFPRGRSGPSGRGRTTGTSCGRTSLRRVGETATRRRLPFAGPPPLMPGLAANRDGQKAAKQAIFALHRGDAVRAANLLRDVEQCVTDKLMPILLEEPALR